MAGGANRPLTDDDREAVRRLHAQGMSRNDIAREIGRSSSTVTKIATALGLSFDRAATAAATQARTADLAARRAALAEKLHDKAERLLAEIHAPHLYFDWGGKDHTFGKFQAPQPTAADKRALMGAVGLAVDRSLKLVPPRDDAAAESRSVLGDLMAGLLRNYTERHGGPPADPVEPADDGE